MILRPGLGLRSCCAKGVGGWPTFQAAGLRDEADRYPPFAGRLLCQARHGTYV